MAKAVANPITRASWVTIVVFAALLSTASAAVELPRQAPRFTALTPGGKALLWVASGAGGDAVVWQALATPSDPPDLLWQADGWIEGLQWLLQDQLLVMVRRANRVRWYRLSFPTGGQQLLLSESVERRLGPRLLRVMPDGALLLANDRARPWRSDLLRLSAGGRQTLVERNPGQLFRWHPAPSGETLLARRWRMDEGQPAYEWVWRREPAAPWRSLRRRTLAEPAWRLLGFTEDAKAAWFSEGEGGVYRVLDFSSGSLDPRPAGHTNPNGRGDHDAGALLPGLPQPQALVVGSRLEAIRGPDEQTRRALAALGERIAERQVFWLGETREGSLWQLGPDPGGVQLYTVSDRGVRSWPGVTLPAGHPVSVESFVSRDNQPVEVLVTRPAGRARSMVLLIHGGPWSHDQRRWHDEAQWLADLGYLVLQVNYRGSTNQGAAWQWAGRREWAGAMLDDLEDAVRWARRSGLPGSHRGCAMGGSFGGYAALMLAARPDPVTRCTVARAPVSDLPRHIEDLKAMGNERGYREWLEMVGDPADPALAAASPVNLAANIRGPVLLGHGDRDTVVAFDQSRRLRARLRRGNAEAELTWVRLRRQAHDLRGAAARRAWYEAVAGFLDRSLADD